MQTGKSGDPLEGDPRVEAFFGRRFPAVSAYVALLRTYGVDRGLIGPREVERLWDRHILNCASVVPFLPDGPVADVGSGAGLPGLVVAAMEPEREVILIESMGRRAIWLDEAASTLGLTGVRVMRIRAEEVRDGTTVQAVLARAVAPIDRLLPRCDHLVAPDGEILLLKGRRAGEEVDSAGEALRRRGYAAEILDAPTIEGVEPTTIVRLRRGVVGRGGR
ncbi:MAG: 16S rRNA (guanine(527)-N(7))-methyltransferase RsmG [Demequinaceae bacterium]|nr:16S rRNA (guanine(527)-N(7))-methyltransferase RsmG [Demequinaceae bacterium]